MSENTSATAQKEQDKAKPATDGSLPEKDLDKVSGGDPLLKIDGLDGESLDSKHNDQISYPT